MGTTTFKGISSIGENTHGEVIHANIVSYLDWAFLEAGAFFNITVGASGAFGGDRSRLRPVKDPRYADGRVWESYRKNWVWESGLTNTSQPVSISGLFVNNTFSPINSGYKIDYPNGRVIFNSAISESSNVRIGYSHKWVTIDGDGREIQKAIEQNSFRVDDSNFIIGSGSKTQLADARVQLPAIVVEKPTTYQYEGYQLGGSQWSRQRILFGIYAEDKQTALKLANIISNQKDQTLFVYDSDRVMKEGAYPLKYDGSLSTNPQTYPNLIRPSGDGGYLCLERFQNGKMYVASAEEQNIQELNSRLFYCPVRWTVESVLNKI